MVRLFSIVFVILMLGISLFGCQGQETVPPPTTTVPSTPVAPSPPEEKEPAPPPPVVTPPPPPPPPPIVTPPPATENVTEPLPEPPVLVLPRLASLTVNMQNVEIFRVTAVFRFDMESDPGFYYFTLLSDNDSFGNLVVEWYRASKQVSLEWPVYAGREAYYRLRNDEPVGDVLRTEISYKKFVSLTTIPRDSPSDLEREIVDAVNRERTFRGLPSLLWDNDLYKQALQRLVDLGEEGKITPPPAGQPFLEIAYMSPPGVGDDTITILKNWVVDQDYLAVLTNPDVKSFAIRTETFNNNKFYAIGLFKK